MRLLNSSSFRMLHRLLLLLAALPLVSTFSSGGGQGEDEHGNPFLQSCDALYVCAPTCPPGMTAVAPPNRTNTYRLGTALDTTTYEPEMLVTLYLNITKRRIPGKRNAGAKIVGDESAKYLGLLL